MARPKRIQTNHSKHKVLNFVEEVAEPVTSKPVQLSDVEKTFITLRLPLGLAVPVVIEESGDRYACYFDENCQLSDDYYVVAQHFLSQLEAQANVASAPYVH